MEEPIKAETRAANGASHPAPEDELVYRVKSAIDETGRYDFRLNDIAAGFAAGLGVSHSSARSTIEDRFSDQIGQSPKDYLEQRFGERQKARDRER